MCQCAFLGGEGGGETPNQSPFSTVDVVTCLQQILKGSGREHHVCNKSEQELGDDL